MKLLDDLNKRKKVKRLIEEIENEIINVQSVDDVKKVLIKFVESIKELI